MTVAVRGIVELFRLVKREKGLHREILAFSISHDHETVRIYGHYPVIDGKKTTVYHHPIRKFDYTELDGKEKWTAYKFTKKVYDIWMPTHLKRICSVIDDLTPNLDFEVSQQSEPGEYRLSQGLESHHISGQASIDAASMEEANSQSSHIGLRDVTPDTSVNLRTSGGHRRIRDGSSYPTDAKISVGCSVNFYGALARGFAPTATYEAIHRDLLSYPPRPMKLSTATYEAIPTLKIFWSPAPD